MTGKPPLALYLAAPRGFCAGVDRAVKIVEMAIEKWGAPVYVRHEIVHNKFVVDGLRDKGAVFVEELDECPTDRPVIFSAHGVPKAVPAEAERLPVQERLRLLARETRVDVPAVVAGAVLAREADREGADRDARHPLPGPGQTVRRRRDERGDQALSVAELLARQGK